MPISSADRRFAVLLIYALHKMYVSCNIHAAGNTLQRMYVIFLIIWMSYHKQYCTHTSPHTPVCMEIIPCSYNCQGSPLPLHTQALIRFIYHNHFHIFWWMLLQCCNAKVCLFVMIHSIALQHSRPFCKFQHITG